MRKFDKKHDYYKRYQGLPYQGIALIILLILLSFIIHLGGYRELYYLSKHRKIEEKENKFQKSKKISVSYIKKPKRVDKDVSDRKKKEQDLTVKKILEAPQEKTEKPKEAKYKGVTDHKTAKETRVDPLKIRDNTADPSAIGGKKKSKVTKISPKKAPPKIAKAQKRPKLKAKPLTSASGRVIMGRPKPNKYESLIPTPTELAHQMKVGYQDYIDEELEIGERIDINTTDYRFIGYFTNFRKAFQLVWNYPYQAIRQGMQGEVGMEFTIRKDGTISGIKVINSSGYDILDDAVVRALKQAAPYSPLPSGIGKDKLLITGNFRYVLRNFSGS